jgi:glycosyltransferase involved in cell wall biosynthesis
MENSLVSVIMPARNIGDFVGDAIRSVLAQSWSNWELIIVENDSDDTTGSVIRQFPDPRIHHLMTPIAGLSHARNMGLATSRGEFICFLDGDDRLPPRSIESRLKKFSEFPDLFFVDGKVITFDAQFSQILREWTPCFEGIPLKEMGRIQPACFSAITWMIRRNTHIHLEFDSSWTHLEDRAFFLSVGHVGAYSSVNQEIYHIRRRSGSLMSDHRMMEEAFSRFLQLVKNREILTEHEWLIEKKVFHRMFARTYAKNLNFLKAAHHYLRYLELGQ